MFDDKISSFSGEHEFLSNFHPSEIVLGDGFVYPTVEHAYQASKTFDSRQREEIQNAKTPGIAKRLGQKVTLRFDWETSKISMMRYLVQQKFETIPELRQKLLDTGNAYLEEGNHWGDTFWGVCDGKGLNHLGIILMNVREKLKEI